jgi:hypothetical protein
MAKKKSGNKAPKGPKAPTPKRKDFMRDMKKASRPITGGRPKK